MKETKTNLVNCLIVILFFLSLPLMYYALTLFWSGFHNVDLGMNMKVFEAKYNQVLIDTGTDMKTRTSTEIYILGLEQQKNSIGLLFLGVLLFGLCISHIIGRMK